MGPNGRAQERERTAARTVERGLHGFKPLTEVYFFQCPVSQAIRFTFGESPKATALRNGGLSHGGKMTFRLSLRHRQLQDRGALAH
jgi:hypothetical protein